MVPLTMALAAFAGTGVGLLPRYRALAAAVVVVVALIERPPLSNHSPMVVEAQRDAENVMVRQRLTECLLQGLRSEADPREHGIARPLHARDRRSRILDSAISP
jgi:hypothetical protein